MLRPGIPGARRSHAFWFLLLFAASSHAEASTARWTSLHFPADLARDDSAFELFPSLVAELPSGATFDVITESSRAAWFSHLGGLQTVVGSTRGGEFRFGLANGTPAGATGGLQLWVRSDQTRAVAQEPNDYPFERASVSKLDGYGAVAGTSVGTSRHLRVDLSGQAALFRREVGARGRTDSNVTTRPRDAMSWAGAVGLTHRMREGDARLALVASRDDAYAKIKQTSGLYPSLSDRVGTLSEVQSIHLGWIGPVSGFDLATIALRADRTVEQTNLPTAIYETRQRTSEVAAAFGLERSMKPWLRVRAGVEKGYRDSRRDYRRSPSARATSRDRVISPASSSVGVGMSYRTLQFDADVRTEGLIGDAVAQLSVRWNR